MAPPRVLARESPMLIEISVSGESGWQIDFDGVRGVECFSCAKSGRRKRETNHEPARIYSR